MGLQRCTNRVDAQLAALYRRHEALGSLIRSLERYQRINRGPKGLPGAAAQKGRRARGEIRILGVER